MSTYTIDTEEIRMSSILARPFNSKDFKIVDYVYSAIPGKEDFTSMYGGVTLKSVIDRQNSAFVCEVSLKIDTEEFFNSPIDGYEIIIQPADSKDERTVYRQTCYFSDDFEGIIDIGETDTKTLKEKLSEAKTFMAMQSSAPADAALSTVSSRSQAKYISLNGGSSFTDLAKDMIMRGQSPAESFNLSMPTFALPSAKTSFGSVGNSNGPYAEALLEKQSRMTLASGEFPDGKISLTSLRQSSRREGDAGESGYALQSAIEAGVAEIEDREALAAEIVLGNIYKYTQNFFVSKRKFEIPRRCIDGNSSSSSRIKISFKPFILEENQIHSDGLKYEPREQLICQKEIIEERNALFTPMNPPTIRVVNTTPGRISYEVNRGDPVIDNVRVYISHFDPVKGEIVSDSHFQHIPFQGSHDTATEFNIPCVNVSPVYPILNVVSFINGSTALSSNIISRSFPNKLHSGHSYQDTTIITAFNGLTDIRVHLSSIPSDVTYVTLYREDMTLPSGSEGSVKKLIRKQSGGASSFQFRDTEVAPHRRYRYYAVCTRSSGASPRNLSGLGHGKTFGSVGILYEDYTAVDDEVVDRIAPGQTSLFNVSIRHQASLYGEVATENQFFVETSLIDTDFSFFIQSLRSKDLFDVYLDEFNSRKNQLTEIAAFVVERINRRTGERVVLPKLARPNQQFIDRSASVSARDSFTYLFKLCIVNPESFIKASDPSEKPGERAKSLAAIKEAFTLTTGVIPTAELSVGSDGSGTVPGKGPLSSAYTGREYPISVSAEPGSAVVNGFTGNVLGAVGMILQWSVPFTLERDCIGFLVKTTLNGQPLAARMVNATLSDSTNDYVYYDTEYYSEVGVRTYRIACIFKDLTMGPDSTTIVDIREATVPPETLREAEVVQADPELTDSVFGGSGGFPF